MVKLTSEQLQTLVKNIIKEELEEGLFDMFRRKTPTQQEQELVQKLVQKLQGGISTQELASLYSLLSKPVGKVPDTSHIKTISGQPYFKQPLSETNSSRRRKRKK